MRLKLKMLFLQELCQQLVIREAFRSLDDVNLVHVFSQRAVVMQNIPRCI